MLNTRIGLSPFNLSIKTIFRKYYTTRYCKKNNHKKLIEEIEEKKDNLSQKKKKSLYIFSFFRQIPQRSDSL